MTPGEDSGLNRVWRGGADLLALGRLDDRDPRLLRFAWSGSGFAVAFSGTRLRARLSGSRAWLDLRLDGRPLPALEVVPEMEWVALAANLEAGDHELRVVKRTEPLVGELLLSDLACDGAILAPPAAPAVRIEFVGDSITCGYGNLAPDFTHPFDPATEDFTRSYAGLAGALLGADLHCVAWSGLGAVRNFDPEPSPTLLERHRYSNPVSLSDWDFSRWLPHVVVVNLGSNDFFRTPPPDPILFREVLGRFVARQLERSPDLLVVLVDGPLLKNDFPVDERGCGLPSLDTVREHLDDVARQWPDRVFRLSLTSAHPDRGYGADWHPSLAQHQLNGRELADFLRSDVLA